ncbi:unnamed protein product, partial [Mycena citricolor]
AAGPSQIPTGAYNHLSVPISPAVRPNSKPSGSWFQPGNNRCTYKACTFTGSKHSVETHMMDRHLIFPPGWDRRKKQDDWDADPSLKGKRLPIQGTTIVLDTPEQLEAWIAERKRRWPTGQRVEDKKRKMEEAVARGQLSLEDVGIGARKRRRVDDEQGSGDSRGRGRGGTGRGRGRGRGRGIDGESGSTWRGRGRVDSGWRGRGTGRGGGAPVAMEHPPRVEPESSSDDESEDGAPEIVSSKAELAFQPPSVPDQQVSMPQPVKRHKPQQPKLPPRNQFASRPTLLRNLLLPEIRVTVSNLSQAIRFLVDND